MARLTTVLAHELDAAWIIALWKAIHGGDPPPEAVAASAIAALAPVLVASPSTLTPERLESSLKELGIQITRQQETTEALTVRPRQYCFRYKGQIICINLPTVRPPPPG